MFRILFSTFFLFAFSLFGSAEKVFDTSYTARDFSTNPVTINIKGDSFDYELIVISLKSTTGQNDWLLTFNSDTSANYRRYQMFGAGAGKSAAVFDSANNILFDEAYSGTSNYPGLMKMSITGSSGGERYINSFHASAGARILKVSGYWKNTVSEISSLTLTTDVTTTGDARIILYRIPKNASQEKWELIKEGTQVGAGLHSSYSPIDLTVDGNRDIQFKLDVEISGTTANTDLLLQYNSDTTAANYPQLWLYNVNGGINAFTSSGVSGVLADPSLSSVNQVTSFIINAETGGKRLTTSSHSRKASFSQQTEGAHWWNNTISNLTNIRITDNSSTDNGYTTSYKLYRKRNPKAIGENLPFEVVEKVSVSGNFSGGHTFSNLKGNSQTLYKIQWLGDGGAAANTTLYAQFNGDTTNANYVNQLLYAQNSSVFASHSTTAYPGMVWGISYGNESSSSVYFYPKSGEYRPALSSQTAESTSNDFVLKAANTWENSIDEITSIKIYASTTDSLTGTLILSRLK